MQLRRQQERLEQNNVEVLVVTFEDEEHALNYEKEAELGWPIIVDRSRELYDYYGMARAGFWDLWGLPTIKLYLREIIRGNLPRRAVGDVHQRGGDILIDPEGKVRMHHIGKGPADRPEVEEVLELIERENEQFPAVSDFFNLKN